MGADRLTLTVEECAKVLGISRSLAFSAVHDGTIPSFRIGRRILIYRDSIDHLASAGDGGVASTAAVRRTASEGESGDR